MKYKLQLIKILHSEEFKKRYISIRVVILRQDRAFRETFLIDSMGRKRTFALSFFSKGSRLLIFKDIHNKVINGELIGKAFKDSGYSLYRSRYYRFVAKLPRWLKNEFKEKSSRSTGSVYRLYVKSKREIIPKFYCYIFEFDCPDYCPINSIKYYQYKDKKITKTLNTTLTEMLQSIKYDKQIPIIENIL
jgi:hypothetical protein